MRAQARTTPADSYVGCLDRIGWEWSLAFLPNGQMWRRQRKLLWQEFQPSVVAKYQAAQHAGARKLIARLLDSPEKFVEHVR